MIVPVRDCTYLTMKHCRLPVQLISAGTERQAELSANIKRLERELQHSESERLAPCIAHACSYR